MTGIQPYEPDDGGVPRGPCCSCGDVADLPNLVMIPARAPTPGKGWGCFVCGLPSDGAIAAICAKCVDDAIVGDVFVGGELPPIRWVCAGYVGEPGRVLREKLERAVFDHDAAKHRGDLEPAADDADDDVDAALVEAVSELVGGRHHRGDDCEPFTCSNCGRRYAHYDAPPILGWPRDDRTGELVPDPKRPGDVVMYRFCVECTPALRFTK